MAQLNSFTYKKVFSYGVLFESLRLMTGGISILFLIQRGITEKEVGMLKMLHVIIFFITDIPLGYMADKKSKRNTVLAASFFTALWLLGTGFGPNKLFLYLAEACNAIGLALFNGAFHAILINTYQVEMGKNNLEQVLGRYTQYRLYGIIIAVIFSALCPSDSLFLLYAISGISLLILGVLGIFLLPAEVKKYDISNPLMDTRTLRKTFFLVKQDFSHIFSHIKEKHLIRVMGGFACFNLMFIILVNYNQIFIKESFPITHTWQFTLCFIILLGCQSLAGKWVAQRKGELCKNLLLPFSIFICLIGMVGGASFLSSAIFIFLCGYTFFLGVIQIYLEVHMQKSISPSLRASFSSIYSTIVRILASLSFFSISLFYTSFLTVIYFALIVTVIGFILLQRQIRLRGGY